MLESVEDGAKNRLATVFFYLNNVSSGGETNFPRAASERWPNGGPTPRDYFDCSQGLSVYPQEGKVRHGRRRPPRHSPTASAFAARRVTSPRPRVR